MFEDAPFAVRSARRVGLHVVGIHNDHDGRDEDFIRSWSDIFTHNYDDVSLEAIHTFDDAGPQGHARGGVGVVRLLLVAGSPEPSSSLLVSRLAVEADQVLAIDRGAEACRVARRCGRMPFAATPTP